MKKLLFLFCCACFMACSNQPASDTEKNNTAGSPTVSSTLSTESEMEILAGCVDNAKDNAGNDLDDAKAFALCRCVLQEMQKKYPDADSVALVNHLSDTTQVAELAKKCR